MDEKKPTDEEVIRLLEIFANDNEPDGVDRLAKMALNFIHRLQSENKDLKVEIESLKKDYIELDLECRELYSELDKELAEHEEFTQKAQAEIERLTEYNANLNGMCLEFIDKNAELQKQVDKAWFEVGKMCMEERKDTAKEIYDFAKSFFTWDEEGFVRELKELVQKYGVEVE